MNANNHSIAFKNSFNDTDINLHFIQRQQNYAMKHKTNCTNYKKIGLT